MENKVIKSTKKWTIEIIQYEDGTNEMSRLNDGFTSLELIGVCQFTQDDIISQIKGIVKPDIVKRQVIQDDTPTNQTK